MSCVDDALKIRLGDLNFTESLREQTRAAGGEIVETDGVVLMRGCHPHPMHNNAVRVDPSVSPVRAVEAARAFYRDSGYGFIVACLNGHSSDDIAAACEDVGMVSLVAPPAMFVEKRLPEMDVPAGCSLELLGPGDEADFIAVSCRAWATYAIPTDAVAAIFAKSELLGAAHIRVVAAYDDGVPSAVALVLLSHGIGGVYWVGTVPSARGRGLGEACTRAVTNLAFDAGVPLVTLQASPMGDPIYRRMGFESIGSYRLFVDGGRPTRTVGSP